MAANLFRPQCGHFDTSHQLSVSLITVMAHGTWALENHGQIDCLSNVTTKRRKSAALVDLCEGTPLVTGGFPSQRPHNAQRIPTLWLLHVCLVSFQVSTTPVTCRWWCPVYSARPLLSTLSDVETGGSQYLCGWKRWEASRRRHNERDGDSNHRRLDWFVNRLFRRRSKRASKLRVTGICEGNPLFAGGIPSERARNAENVSNWLRRHVSLSTIAVFTSKLFDWFDICQQFATFLHLRFR